MHVPHSKSSQLTFPPQTMSIFTALKIRRSSGRKEYPPAALEIALSAHPCADYGTRVYFRVISRVVGQSRFETVRVGPPSTEPHYTHKSYHTVKEDQIPDTLLITFIMRHYLYCILGQVHVLVFACRSAPLRLYAHRLCVIEQGQRGV